MAYYSGVSTISGTPNLYVSGSNIGIGTATASQPLTVNGNIDTMGASGYLTEIANGSVATVLNSLAKLDTSGHATAALTSDTDGMIGIIVGNAGTSGKAQVAMDGQASCTFDGTTTAGDFVTISSTNAGYCHDTGGTTRSATAQTIGRVLTANSGSGTTATVALGLNALGATGSAIGIGTANYIPMWSNSTTLANSVMYQSGGNVGIGTTEPQEKLHVSGGNINIDPSYWLEWAHGDAGNTEINFGDGSTITRQGVDGHIKFTSQNNNFEFSGNVGIGTTTVGNPLVVNSSNANTDIDIQNAGTTGMQLYTLPNSYAVVNAATASTPLLFAINGAEKMRVNTNGNVGIGTTSPSLTH